MDTSDTGDRPGLLLSPAQARWAVWKKLPPLPSRDPRPFERDSLLAALRKKKAWQGSPASVWDSCKIPDSMGREEASFWFRAIASSPFWGKTGEEIAVELGEGIFKAVSVEEARAWVRERTRGESLDGAIILPLRGLLPAREIADLLMEVNDLYPADAFFDRVLPWLGEEEREACRAAIRGRWESGKKSTGPRNAILYYLAGALGMGELTGPLVEGWDCAEGSSDERGAPWDRDACWYPEIVSRIVCALPDLDRVLSEEKRLGISLKEPRTIRLWIAVTGHRALELPLSAVLQANRNGKGDVERLTQALAWGVSVEMAMAMHWIAAKTTGPRRAVEWLDDHPAEAALGAASLLIQNQDSDVASFAAALLERLALKSEKEALEGALPLLSPDRREALGAILGRTAKVGAEHGWLVEALRRPDGKRQKPRLPPYLVVNGLPPIHADGEAIEGPLLEELLEALRKAGFGSPLPISRELRSRIADGERDGFARALAKVWTDIGSPPKDKWAFAALGHLGSDDIAREVYEGIEELIIRGLHRRASLSLDILRLIGSDLSVSLLNEIALRGKHRAVKRDAGLCMESLARDRGYGRDELEDRLVPDCALGENGGIEGADGRWEILLDPALKPILRKRGEAKLQKELPAASGDEAASRWLEIKKELRKTLRLQLVRLEEALAAGRTWRGEDYKLRILAHPLLGRLARDLLWGIYGRSGSLETAFRVSPEGELLDREDKHVAIQDDATVALAHPVELRRGECVRWGEIFADYAVAQPFPQLSRAAYDVDPALSATVSIPGLVGKGFSAPDLVYSLEKYRWERGISGDGGYFFGMSRAFASKNMRSVIEFDGNAWMGGLDAGETLTVTRAEVLGKGDRPLPLGDLPARVRSEILAAAKALELKAR